MGMLCKLNFWYIFEVVLLAFLQNLSVHEVDAHILVYRRTVNQLIEEYNDLPAKFGAPLPPNGLKVFVVPASPTNFGCDTLVKPPTDYPPTAKFVSLISRGGDCTFERKVRVAQNASYYAVIVYNNEGDDLEQMSADNSTGIHIPAVFVGQTTGTNLRSFYSSDIVLIINDELPFNINTQLILPFSILIGLCFLIMVVYMIYKCIREQRRQRRYRLPKSMLKKIPILRYTKNNTDLVYETCVICLEDFVEDDKVRVLPCRHPYHSHCIDPWLTQNRRVCPICKRKVFTKGEGRSSRNRQPSLDSVTDTDDDTTPLLQQPNGSGTAAGAGSAAAATATAATTSAANTTRHGTFRRGGSSSSTVAISAAENTSDDENALLTQQSPTHGARRMNPFDRAPNLPPHLADMLNESQRPFWSRLNFNFLFRRTPTNISVAAPPYLESVETGISAHTRDINDERSISATAPVPTPTSNNIMNPNLSGSFKDDDDLAPHSSIYEPIGAVGDAAVAGGVESAFLSTPSRGGIGVVALPNTSTDDVVATALQTGANSNQRQFLI